MAGFAHVGVTINGATVLVPLHEIDQVIATLQRGKQMAQTAGHLAVHERMSRLMVPCPGPEWDDDATRAMR